MKLKKFWYLTLGLLVGLCASVLHAANFYVDALTGDDTNAGTEEAPFKTVKAGMTAANALTDEASTVSIKGGDDRTYTIETEEDLCVVTVADLTVGKWGDDKPLITLAETLGTNVANPTVFLIDNHDDSNVQSANNVTFRDLRFSYTNGSSGNSLSERGCIFDFCGNNCVVENCEFMQNGAGSSGKAGSTLIRAMNGNENRRTVWGRNLVVRNCTFTDVKNLSYRVIQIGNNVRIEGNIFTGCDSYFYPPKRVEYGSFVSNRLFRCTAPIQSAGGFDSEVYNFEIAFNIFAECGTGFLQKDFRGMDNVRIHHNTIVGATTFITAKSFNNQFDNRISWTPKIYDNLVVLKDEASLLVENQTALPSNLTTSFDSSNSNNLPDFRGNVYFATGGFVSGNATTLNGYDIEAGLGEGVTEGAGNRPLTITPTFLDTDDVTSPDFYRYVGTHYPWSDAGVGGEYNTVSYVGAIEPAVSEEDFVEIVDFSFTMSGTEPPVTATFTVDYSSHATEAATLQWDFDGDGVVDLEGVDKTVTYTFAKPGDYTPQVTVSVASGATTLSKTIATPTTYKFRLSNIYVDASAAENGGGTEEAPFRTIAEAAAWSGENVTIHVRGGGDRVYAIDTAEDLIVLNAKNMVLQAWEGSEEAPLIEVSPSLATLTNNPSVVTIPSGCDGATVRGLAFHYSCTSAAKLDGNSLGKGGCVIRLTANDCSVEDCTFTQEGTPYRDYNSTYSVRSDAEQGTRTTVGKGMTVRRCRFTNVTGLGVKTGDNATLAENIYDACIRCFFPVKQIDGFSFISNRVINCTTTMSSAGQSYGELTNAELAYNIFVGSDVPFLTKGVQGMSQVVIHHNTIVGFTSFLAIDNFTMWFKPTIFDNLIVLPGDDTSVFVLNASGTPINFQTDSVFRNNAYLANDLITGTALEQDGYSDNLTQTDNIVLTEAPVFINTSDVKSDNFYRPKQGANETWAIRGAAWTNSGAYPDYIGAMAPNYTRAGFTMIVR